MTHDGAPALGTAIRTRDAYFHEPRYRDDSWTETNWFGFFVPEAQLRGSVYALFRTNLGVVRSSVLVYSSQATSVLDVDYFDDRAALSIPPGNLDHYALANGVPVRMTEPMKRWHLRFDGRFDTHFDLELEAMTPPLATQETAIEGARDGYAVFQRRDGAGGTGHLDQTMWVTGEVRVRGRTHPVAFPANRDHSWSPRREWGHNICGNFDEGHFGRELSFQVQTRNDPLEVGEVTHGYVVVRGEPRRLKAGIGTYQYDGWRITSARYDLEDETGRTYRFDGTPVSWCTDMLSGNVANLAVVRWEADGEVGWGDVKWHWDLFRMQEHHATHPQPA